MANVEQLFFPDFNQASGVFNLGEVYNGAVGYTCPYQNYADSVMNYPIYFPLLRAFKSSGGDMAGLGEEMLTVKGEGGCKVCPPYLYRITRIEGKLTGRQDPTVLGSFSENHDVPRFASYTSDMSVSQNLVFPLDGQTETKEKREKSKTSN
jgi:alpha-amylase